jgi:hypothetical protein
LEEGVEVAGGTSAHHTDTTKATNSKQHAEDNVTGLAKRKGQGNKAGWGCRMKEGGRGRVGRRNWFWMPTRLELPRWDGGILMPCNEQQRREQTNVRWQQTMLTARVSVRRETETFSARKSLLLPSYGYSRRPAPTAGHHANPSRLAKNIHCHDVQARTSGPAGKAAW